MFLLSQLEATHTTLFNYHYSHSLLFKNLTEHKFIHTSQEFRKMFEDSIDVGTGDRFVYKLQLVREMNKFFNKAVEGTESEVTS